MDNRFRPIGGMFQGVRGTTSEGGDAKHAAKLVKLNNDGLIDTSCLPAGVKDAAQLHDDLQREISARIEGDLDLATRQETFETVVTASLNETSDRLSAVEHDVTCLSEKHTEDMESVNTSISGLDSRLSDAEHQIGEHSDSISLITSTITDDENRILSLENVTSSLDGRVGNNSNEISKIKQDVSSIAVDTSSVMTQVSTWVTGLNTLTNDMTTLKNDMTALEDSTRNQFETITMAINDLNQRITEIYRRLFPDNPEQQA